MGEPSDMNDLHFVQLWTGVAGFVGIAIVFWLTKPPGGRGGVARA